ncbi:MAG: isocitrate lyase/phosphoenolpyruvate mutase family protein, partial [Ginsengibacter sp.]
YLHDNNIAGDEAKLTEVIKRGSAYKEAGADGFFPIMLNREDAIQQIIARVSLPLNVPAIPGIPGLKRLREMGVARVSLGPSFLKIALGAMKQLAMQLKEYDGLSSITGNEINSEYLKNLVNKKY